MLLATSIGRMEHLQIGVTVFVIAEMAFTIAVVGHASPGDARRVLNMR